MAEQQKVAAFDIDGTIFRSNLLVEIVDTLVEQGTFPRKIKKQFRTEYQAWREQRHRESYVKYIDRLVATYLSYIKGTTAEEMDAAVASVMEYVPQLVYVYGRELVTELKPTHFLLAISGSPAELVGPFVRRLGFNDYHASQYEVVEGVYTGNAVAGHHHKDKTLLRKVKEHNLTLEGSIGMGDTDADISMLSLVQRPIAFNPNKELLEHALQNGWEILSEHKDTIYHIQGGILRRIGDFGHYYTTR